MSELQLKQTSEVVDQKVVIIREYKAPINLVFDALTQEEHLMSWFCPSNFEMEFAEVDFKVGGIYRTGMVSLDGKTKHVMRGEYKKIEKPNKIIKTQQWETPEGFSPSLTITIDLAQKGEVTTMKFVHDGFMDIETRDSHLTGWNECFDKFVGVLK